MTERIHDPRTPVDKNDSTQSQNPQPELGHSGTLGYERPPIDPTTGKPVYGTRGIQEEHLGDPAGLAKLEDADRKEVEAIAGIVYGPEAVGTDTTVNPGKIDSDIEQEGNKKADKSRKIGGKTIALVTAGLVGVTSAVVGAIAYFSPKEVSANPGATPSASAPVTPGPSPSSAESSAVSSPSPTETSSSPSSAETKSPSESLQKLEKMSPAEFFKLPKADQMLYFGAALQTAQKYPGAFFDDNKGINDESQLVYFNPAGGGELFPDVKPASKDDTDQDILNRDRFINQLIYRGIEVGTDEQNFVDAYDADTANKLVALQYYYPNGTDFRNAVKNSEALAGHTFTGTSEARDEKSQNEQNADHEGNKVISRRVAFTEETADANGDPVEVKGVRQYFLVDGKMPNGASFQTWIRYNV